MSIGNALLSDMTAADLSLFGQIEKRLAAIENTLMQLTLGPVAGNVTKDWYSTAEFAAVVKKRPFTVREWCRLGRVHAQKRPCGRGPTQEWMISREELVRYQNEGLLPVPRVSTRV